MAHEMAFADAGLVQDGNDIVAHMGDRVIVGQRLLVGACAALIVGDDTVAGRKHVVLRPPETAHAAEAGRQNNCRGLGFGTAKTLVLHAFTSSRFISCRYARRSRFQRARRASPGRTEYNSGPACRPERTPRRPC